MGVALTSITDPLTLQDPTSDVRVNFDTQFEATMADALVRPVESVDVVDVTIAMRRALVGECQVACVVLGARGSLLRVLHAGLVHMAEGACGWQLSCACSWGLIFWRYLYHKL
jgi:hypothetical protein